MMMVPKLIKIDSKHKMIDDELDAIAIALTTSASEKFQFSTVSPRLYVATLVCICYNMNTLVIGLESGTPYEAYKYKKYE